MEPKISCIIPYYNGDKEYLRQSVDSVLAQDFEDFEILLVDDGSDAFHAAQLEEIGRLDERIRVIHQPRQGVSAARNEGIRQARGEYLAFVDADDVVVPYYFSEAYRVASACDADYVVGGTVATHDRGRQVGRVDNPRVAACPAGEFRTEFLVVTERMQEDGYFGRGPVARLIRREVAASAAFPENVSIGEDGLWNMDVLTHCGTVYKVYQIWYLYWQNADSACHRYDENMVGVIEEHLREMIPRMDFSRAEEAEAYFLRMYENLRQQVFGCYFGRKECPLPLLKRARAFRALCGTEPWSHGRDLIDRRRCGRRTRIKLFLVTSGLLYWFWYFRSFVRKEGA